VGWYYHSFNCGTGEVIIVSKKNTNQNNLTWEQIQNIRPQDIKGIKCPNFLQQIPKFNNQFSYESLLEVKPNHQAVLGGKQISFKTGIHSF